MKRNVALRREGEGRRKMEGGKGVEECSANE